MEKVEVKLLRTCADGLVVEGETNLYYPSENIDLTIEVNGDKVFSTRGSKHFDALLRLPHPMEMSLRISFMMDDIDNWKEGIYYGNMELLEKSIKLNLFWFRSKDLRELRNIDPVLRIEMEKYCFKKFLEINHFLKPRSLAYRRAIYV